MSEVDSQTGVPTPVKQERPNAIVVPRSRSAMMQTISPIFDRDKVRSWILAKSSPSAGAYRCTHFVLAHVVNLGDRSTNDLITQAPLPMQDGKRKIEGAEREARVDEIVDEFEQNAESHVSNMSEIQRYAVCALLSDRDGPDGELGSGRTYAQLLFTLAPTDDPETEIASGFTSSHHGPSKDLTSSIVQHLAHNNETAMRLIAQNGQTDKDRLRDMFETAQERADRLEQDRFEMRVKFEELLDRSEQRKQEVEENRFKLNLQHMAVNELIKLLGPVAKQVLVAKGLVPPADGEHPMMTFAKTLSPRQLLQFMGTLSEEQRTMFSPMGSALLEAMPAERQKELGEILQADQQAQAAKAEGGVQ